jgi:hypothetical protein
LARDELPQGSPNPLRHIAAISPSQVRRILDELWHPIRSFGCKLTRAETFRRHFRLHQ